MSGWFKVIDDATVILREKGYYKQAAVYQLGERLFAEARKGSYIGLLGNEATSAPSVTWSQLNTPFKTVLKEGRIVEVKND